MKLLRKLFCSISILIYLTANGVLANSRFSSSSIHFVQPASSSPRPWRTYGESRGPNSYYQRKDLSQKFLPWNEAKNDKRTRIWKGNSVMRRKPGTTSWTTKLLFLNIAAYAIQVFYPRFTSWGVKRSDLILQGRDLYRLLSPVFLHGGPAHLMMNMYSLTNVGPDVERLFGSGRFLCTYLLAGIAGNAFSAFQSPNPALGASGAVFGILGAYTVFLTRHEWLLGRMGERASSQLMQTAFLNIALGFANPSIDNWGHIGGFVGGCAMAYYAGPRLYVTSRFDSLDHNFLVDRPVFRLPRPIESIPEKMGHLASRITKNMRIDRLFPGGDGSLRPWQHNRQPRDLPPWSVRPDK